MDTLQAIVFFDDTCILCNRFAQWIIKKDKKAYFKFTGLHTPLANAVFLEKNFEASTINSVIVLDKDIFYTHSDAVLYILLHLDTYKKLATVLQLVPKFLRDIIYKYIARNRKGIFGTAKKCMISQDYSHNNNNYL